VFTDSIRKADSTTLREVTTLNHPKRETYARKILQVWAVVASTRSNRRQLELETKLKSLEMLELEEGHRSLKLKMMRW
jgi:hypothetical protein